MANGMQSGGSSPLPPAGARIHARTIKLNEHPEPPKSTAEDVANWRRSFLLRGRMKQTDWETAATFYAKPLFILARDRFSESMLHALLVDRGLLFSQDFDELIDEGNTFEDKVVNGRFFRENTSAGESSLDFAAAKFIKLHKDMTPSVQVCFDQYIRNAKTQKMNRDQLETAPIPTDGLSEQESAWLQQYIRKDLFSCRNWRDWIKAGNAHFEAHISPEHCAVLDEIREQEQQLAALKEQAEKWKRQEKLPNGYPHAKYCAEKDIEGLIQNAAAALLLGIPCPNKIAEKVLNSCSEVNVSGLYSALCRSLLNSAKMRSDPLIKIILVLQICRMCRKIAPKTPQTESLQMIWQAWSADPAFKNKTVWDRLTHMEPSDLEELEQLMPPITLGLYIHQLLYTSLPENTQHLAYDNLWFVEAATVQKYKAMYPDLYEALIQHEMKSSRIEEYQKLWSNTKTTREDRIEYIQRRMRYINLDIPKDMRIWQDFRPLQAAHNEQEQEKRMIKYSTQLKPLIIEDAWQYCIRERARTVLWDKASSVLLF